MLITTKVARVITKLMTTEVARSVTCGKGTPTTKSRDTLIK